MSDGGNLQPMVPSWAFWSVCALNLLTLACGVLLVVEADATGDTIRVRCVEVIDDRGSVRFRIGAAATADRNDSGQFVAFDRDGVEVLAFRGSETAVASLSLGRRNGNAGVELIVSKSGAGTVFTFSGDGSPLVGIGQSDNGAGSIVAFKNTKKQVEIGSTGVGSGLISVFGSSGNPVAAAFGGPGDVGAICVFDGSKSDGGVAAVESSRVYMSANHAGGVLTVFNAEGSPIVECEGLPTGGGAVRCNSLSGRSAVAIGSSSDGVPTIEVLATDGTPLVGIGSSDGSFGAFGLFGPGGLPQFAAGGDASGGRIITFDSRGVPRAP